MKSAQTLTAPLDHDAVRHLRPVEQERKSVKFAALDHEVARVLGPQRGPSLIYAFLASSWYEFAGVEKLAEIKKRSGRTITPGDWVEVSYDQFMGITGTRAVGSIIRWLRALSEETHACPWGRCGDEHPLIVIKRQGQSRPNRYRRWKCGEDILVLRPRITSKRLSEVARRRVECGQQLNGIKRAESHRAELVENVDERQILLLAVRDSSEQHEALISKVSPQDFKSSTHESPNALAMRVHDISRREAQNSYDKTSLREKTDFVGPTVPKTTANDDGAAVVDEINETDAVACEIVEGVVELARRVEPAYPDDRGWSVARRLASVALETTQGEPAHARALLLRAIGDRRLARASNPIGLLIRGVVGDVHGRDRYLIALSDGKKPARNDKLTGPTPPAKDRYETPTGLAPGLDEALQNALRRGHVPDSEWLRERDIQPEVLARARALVASDPEGSSDTPLTDRLAMDDPTGYKSELEAILRDLPLPERFVIERRIDHPMLLGMCRAKLEADLQRKKNSAEARTIP